MKRAYAAATGRGWGVGAYRVNVGGHGGCHGPEGDCGLDRKLNQQMQSLE